MHPKRRLYLAIGLMGVIGAAALAIATASSTLAQDEVDTSDPYCLTCHSRRSLDFELPSGEVIDVTVDGPAFGASVHGRVGTQCIDCHGDVGTYPHPAPAPATARDLTIDLNQTCGDCHEGAAAAVAVHAAAGPVAVCSDCHGSHEVASPAESPDELIGACGACHGAEMVEYDDSVHGVARRRGIDTSATCVDCHAGSGIHSEGGAAIVDCTDCHTDVGATYDASIHGMLSAAGEMEAATCNDCHGPAHSMRASDDANSTTYPLNLPETCGMCHGDPELTARLGLDNVYELYVDSIHGSALEESGLVVAANCSSCHGTHGIRLPSDPSSTVYPLHVPETCGTCHVRILEQYRESVHGVSVSAGELAAAICTDCHTSHTITPTDAPEWQLDVVEECGTCHEASIETFRDTFHGQVSGLGFTRAARCSDCHGAHGIRPIEDPESLVADANRVETCRQCHPDANSNFAEYSPHADHGDRENYPTLFYAARLMNGLIIGVFAFFGIHTLLWFNRTSLDRFRERWRNRKSASSTTDEGSAGEGAE